MSRWIDHQERNSHDSPLTRRVFSTTRQVRTPIPAQYAERPPEPIEQPVVPEPAPLPPEPVMQYAAEVSETVKQKPSKHKYKAGRRKNRVLTLVVLMAVVVGGLWFTSRGGQPAQPEVLAAQTVEEIAAIDTDEKPVILYVVDKTKVQQEFLSKAENGDEVWLYYQAKKAVLYRPSTDTVVSTGEFLPPSAKVFIRNGTINSGQLSKVESKLKTLQGYNIVSRDKSSNTRYADTLVINVSGRYAAEAEKLAGELGATVGSLPRGETRPDADILVIVGAR